MNNSYLINHKVQNHSVFPAKVTLDDLENFTISEHYFTARDGANECRDNTTKDNKPKNLNVFNSLGLMTFCVLVLKNGFKVRGVSSCVDPKEFNAEKGKMIARSNAINEMWPLMGVVLANSVVFD